MRQYFPRSASSFIYAALAILHFLAPFQTAHAHAVLQASNPAANATVAAGVVPIRLTYNSRVDAAHSSLSLLAHGKTQSLTIDTKSDPNILSSRTAPLQPGHYVLRWQALAADGHVSRGQIVFTVK